MTAAADVPAVDMPLPLWRQLIEDLKPFPRRAGMAWRVALLCALVTGAGMMYEIPEASISCYLIIFLMKPDAIVNAGTGAGVLALLFGVVALLVWIVNLTLGSTLHIMLAIIISSFLLVYLGGASQLGEKGGVAALIIAFLLTLIVKAPFGAAAGFALREAWAMAAMPMALMVVFNLTIGYSPVLLLQDKLRARLSAAAKAAETPSEENLAELRELLREGNAPFEQQALSVRLLRLAPKLSGAQIDRDVRAGYAVMLAVSALPPGLSPVRRAALAMQIRAAESSLEAGEAPPPPAPPAEDATEAERAAIRALGILAGEPEPTTVKAPKIPFLAPDAFTNPEYARFAMKTTLAAVICFLTYTAIDWQDIHTAMITCYVAALGTLGETVHKLALRIGGCLVGAAIGVASLAFVIPHIDNVAALMVLVFAGCWVGAWVSTGPERISYAGVQVALAFLLTVLQGFGPSISLDTAWGRIVGILLGNVVVYLIFTRIWVAPIEVAVRRILATALKDLAVLARVAPDQRRDAVPVAAAVDASTGQAKDLMDLFRFEPDKVRPTRDREDQLRLAVAEIEAANNQLWLSRGSLDDVANGFDVLASEFSPAAAPPSDPDVATMGHFATTHDSLRKVARTLDDAER